MAGVLPHSGGVCPQRPPHTHTHTQSGGSVSLANEDVEDILSIQQAQQPPDSDTMPREMAELVTFTGHDEVLRGSRLTTLLRRAAVIYKNSEGSAETYKLSQKVSALYYFISHNWAVSRYAKFIAMAFFFNLSFSIAVLGVYSIVLLALGFSNMLPAWYDSAGDRVTGYFAVLTCLPVFFGSLFFGRDILHLFGHRGASVFLDKTCIHQTDKATQRVGILKLGAFLSVSEYMIVLYSSIYLRKLWTIYEVAAFLSMKPASRMIVLPIDKYLALLCTLMLSFLYQAVTRIMFTLIRTEFANQLFLAILVGAHIYICRRWVRERELILETVSRFRVEDCVCFCEEDRPVVYRNIAKLMRGCGTVQQNVAEAEALASFEHLVRSKVFSQVFACIGRWSYSYEVYSLIGFALSGGILLDYPVRLHYQRTGCVVAAEMLLVGVWVLVWWPLCILLCEFLAKTKSHLKGIREVGWLCAIIIFELLVGVTIFFVTYILQETAAAGSNSRLASNLAFAGQVALALVGAGLLRWLLRTPSDSSSGPLASAPMHPASREDAAGATAPSGSGEGCGEHGSAEDTCSIKSGDGASASGRKQPDVSHPAGGPAGTTVGKKQGIELCEEVLLEDEFGIRFHHTVIGAFC